MIQRTPHLGSRGVAVFDIDGVLADNKRRMDRLDPTNPDWAEFHHDQHEDPLIADNAALLQLLWDADYSIMVMTNRFEAYREQTTAWLRAKKIPFTRLIMRVPGQRYVGAKADNIQALLDEGLNVVLYVDDDPGHCQEVRDLGIPVIYVHSGYLGFFTQHFPISDLPDDPIGATA